MVSRKRKREWTAEKDPDRFNQPGSKRSAIFELLKKINVAEQNIINVLREQEAHPRLERISAMSSQVWDAIDSLRVSEIAILTSSLHNYYLVLLNANVQEDFEDRVSQCTDEIQAISNSFAGHNKEQNNKSLNMFENARNIIVNGGHFTQQVQSDIAREQLDKILFWQRSLFVSVLF